MRLAGWQQVGADGQQSCHPSREEGCEWRTIDKSVENELPVLLHQVVDVAEDSTVKREMSALERALGL